jgi:hypothetical protein
MQIAQRRYGYPRVTKFHPHARDRIEHPARYRPDDACTRFNMDNAAATALFNISNLDTTAVQRMPTIMDFDFLPDMGRMSGHL